MIDLKNEEIFQQYPLPHNTLPEGWAVVSLDEIAVVVSPGFASGKHTSDGIGIPHLRPMNVDREGKVDLSVVKYVAGSNGIDLSNGDVLFNNTNSPELIGKTAIISPRENGFAFSNHMTRIRLKKGITPAYISQHLHFLWMSGYLKHRCTNHVNQASISSKTLANTIPILLPPTNEQFKIVGKLEEVISDLDAGVAELKSAQKKLAQYRQSLLKAAVEGTLTAEWRTKNRPKETGAQLLERILKERRARWEEKQLAKFKEQDKTPPKCWRDKYPEPVQPNTTNLPQLPEGWVWTSLDQFFYELRSGTAETSGRQETSYPVLKSSAVRQGKIDFQALNYLQQKQSERAENYLAVGDVLITRLSGSVEYVGCCAVVRDVPSQGVQFPDRIFQGKLPLSFMWLGDYLAYCFQSAYIRTILESAAKSTAGHKRISLSDLFPLPIPLPPSDEVESILQQVSDSIRRAEDGEIAIVHSLAQTAAQRKNILKSAFSGQLVSQDPDDEPASVLLERIREERKPSIKTSKKTVTPRRKPLC